MTPSSSLACHPHITTFHYQSDFCCVSISLTHLEGTHLPPPLLLHDTKEKVGGSGHAHIPRKITSLLMCGMSATQKFEQHLSVTVGVLEQASLALFQC